MKIRHMALHHLRIPLRVRFAQANQDTRRSDSVVLALTTDRGVAGYGECCPRLYVTGEDPRSVSRELRALRTALANHRFETLDDIRKWVVHELPHRLGLAALCALEGALLDAWSRTTDTDLIAALGGQPRPVLTYTGVIPFGDIERLRPVISRFHFQEFKIKVGPDLTANLEKVKKLRAFTSPAIPLRVDANCSWRFPDALQQIPALRDAGVTVFEQPFPQGQDIDMGKITARFGEEAEIMADESVCSYAQAEHLLENRFCNRLNLKVSKHGGILHTLRIVDLAERHGVRCQLGAHFGETSLLTAAGMIVACVADAITSREGGLGTHLLENDICDPPLSLDEKASLYPHTQPGLGPAVNTELLARNTVDTLQLPI